jgi:hypothetical protein
MATLTEHKTLLMRANRTLGAALMELNLVKIQDIEQANEKFLELVAKNELRQASILSILSFDLKSLREEDLLQHVVEVDGVGLVDLRDYDVPDESRRNLDVGACWATWSVPFDKEEEFHFVATAYYLSPAVRAFWEKQLGSSILWFGTTLEGIADYLDRFQNEKAASLNPFAAVTQAPFAAPPPPPPGTGNGTPRIFAPATKP